jgi:hypothetical protein
VKGRKRTKRKRSYRKVTEEKLTVGVLIKIVVLTVLACIGFFVLWAFVFLLSLPLMNSELSVFLSMLISAITIFALITVLIPLRRSQPVPSKRQRVATYVAWTIISALYLPLIKINFLLFLFCLPALTIATFIVIHDALRWRKGKEIAKK